MKIRKSIPADFVVAGKILLPEGWEQEATCFFEEAGVSCWLLANGDYVCHLAGNVYRLGVPQYLSSFFQDLQDPETCQSWKNPSCDSRWGRLLTAHRDANRLGATVTGWKTAGKDLHVTFLGADRGAVEWTEVY